MLELPKFATQDAMVEFYVQEFGMSLVSANALRLGIMFSRRSILCVGLNTSLNLVLSVDSEREKAFMSESNLLKHGPALHEEMQLLLPVLREPQLNGPPP